MALAGELGISERELRSRRQFAEEYPTEEIVRNAFRSFRLFRSPVARRRRA
jgi:hypothetical protein